MWSFQQPHLSTTNPSPVFTFGSAPTCYNPLNTYQCNSNNGSNINPYCNNNNNNTNHFIEGINGNGFGTGNSPGNGNDAHSQLDRPIPPLRKRSSSDCLLSSRSANGMVEEGGPRRKSTYPTPKPPASPIPRVNCDELMKVVLQNGSSDAATARVLSYFGQQQHQQRQQQNQNLPFQPPEEPPLHNFFPMMKKEHNIPTPVCFASLKPATEDAEESCLIMSPQPPMPSLHSLAANNRRWEGTFGADCILRDTTNFKLWEQPEEYQRKAYKNENRYILPNPLVVTQVKPESGLMHGMEPAALKECQVSVRLVHYNGEELEDEQGSALEGMRLVTMVGCEGERKAEFSLKVRVTSGKGKFRLCFTVVYTCEGQKYKEIILSRAFKVICNKKKSNGSKVFRPLLVDLSPRQGFAGEETELWIRGCHFQQDSSSTSVKIGDKLAKIVDVEENLIICLAPPRPDLAHGGERACEDVVVSVVTQTSDGCYHEAFKKLFFQYIPSLSGQPSRPLLYTPHPPQPTPGGLPFSSFSDEETDSGSLFGTEWSSNPMFDAVEEESENQIPPAVSTSETATYNPDVLFTSDGWISSHGNFFKVLENVSDGAPRPEHVMEYNLQQRLNKNACPKVNHEVSPGQLCRTLSEIGGALLENGTSATANSKIPPQTSDYLVFDNEDDPFSHRNF